MRIDGGEGWPCSLIRPEIRDDPIIFPSVDLLRGDHFYTPLSLAGEGFYADVWARFLAAEH